MIKTMAPEEKALRESIIRLINPGLRILEASQKNLSASSQEIDGKAIIDLLKQARPHPKGPLAALWIEWVPINRGQPSKMNPWLTVMRLLMKAGPEDGLFLTDALIKTLPARKDVRHELCNLVLGQVDWRIQAIERYPHLFVPTRKKFFLPFLFNETRHRRNSWDGNAFVMLATLESKKSTKENVTQTIQALERIGAVPGVHKEKQGTVLHKIASHLGFGTVQTLAAFVEHFKHLRDTKDRDGFTPLHLAAMNGLKDNVITLLKAGASTQVLGVMGDSPLDEAVKAKHMNVVQALCEHGKHDSFSLRRARSWAGTGHIKAYLDSQVAKLALDEMMSKANAKPFQGFQA